jgi:hypothetical protein
VMQVPMVAKLEQDSFALCGTLPLRCRLTDLEEYMGYSRWTCLPLHILVPLTLHN